MTPTPEERIQQALQSCSVVEEFRSAFDDVRQCRNVFQMDAEGASTNFTITQLANSQCFAAPPLTLTSVKGRIAITIHYIGVGMAGHPGVVHGGAIATILDECFGKAATTHFEALHEEQQAGQNDGSFDPRKGVLAVTAQLSVDFKNATHSDSIVVTRAAVDADKSSARKATVSGQMWQVDRESSERLELVAAGGGLFIRPRANA